MPHRIDIVTFHDPPVPDGASPWVPGAGPSFHIDVADSDPAWQGWFDELAGRVRRALGWRALVIEHVGSTSVPGLPAKPIIDIDLVVADPADEASYLPALEAEGFELRVREPWWFEHRVLRSLEPRCHLHVFGYDSPEVVKHRLFRDWLRGNPDERDLYATTKRDAAATANEAGEHSMQYNARKEQVVREIYQRAFLAAGLLDG
ncbi:GrpB family protein [Nocardioides bizhenqiangii]|uniref:GrpB family protein n=1 Tax=Nocardioides bizhenqiangii TaxID=3095076 RepID=A0ABZ0ZQ31_9ACTN|nr:GrpB family protein [Nocardioides sp. HM61]WQQ26450.1 GrpB family protein [Nocardioides sp. HM61]